MQYALVRLDQSQLQRAERQDFLRDLLTQARDVQVFHVPQQVLNTCSDAVNTFSVCILEAVQDTFGLYSCGGSPISSASAAPISH